MAARWQQDGMAARYFSFREFDGSINHILGKLDRDGKSEVVDELAIDVEDDVLLELRDRVFILAKDIYENKLRETETIGIDEKVDITLQKRNKSGDNQTISKDVVDLYEYTVGLSTVFPKNVLTRTSKLKEVKEPGAETAEKKNQAQEWKDLFASKNKEVIHQRIFNSEVMNRMKDQEKKIDSLLEGAEKNRKAIQSLETELNKAKEEIITLKAVVGIEKVGTLLHTSKPEEIKEVKDNPNSNQEKGASKDKETKAKCDICCNNNTEKKEEKKETPTSQGSTHTRPMVTRVTESNGKDFTTYIHKRGTPGSLPIEQERMQQQHQQHNSYGDNNYRRRQLRGVRKEKATSMYLSGIEIEEETNEDIVRIVKDHAWDKGIRIMGHHVIRTKRFPYVVGCKIVLPETQEYLALSPDTWPEEVSCRKWEPAWKRNANNGYSHRNYNEDSSWDSQDRGDRDSRYH